MACRRLCCYNIIPRPPQNIKAPDITPHHYYFLNYTKRRYHEISYSEHGEISNVLSFHQQDQQETTTLNQPDKDMTYVKMLYAPWNPADVNTVEGKYPKLPYQLKNISMIKYSKYFPNQIVAGSEGIGQVVASSTNKIPTGSFVTFGRPGFGTLRSNIRVPSNDVIVIKRGQELFDAIGAASASTLFQLGGTAFGLLEGLSMIYKTNNINQGKQIVIQNAGNSSVGFMVSQMASSALYRNTGQVISIARRGSKTQQEWNDLVHYLMEQGRAVAVIAEEDITTKEQIIEFQKEILSKFNKPTLALNAVGGDSAKRLLSFLGQDGTMITYGGMSKQPITVSTPHLLFKNLTLKGYWNSAWMINASQLEKEKRINSLVDLVLSNDLQCPPIQTFSLQDFQKAFDYEKSMNSNSTIRKKIVFDCQSLHN